MRTRKVSAILCGLIFSFWTLGVANGSTFQNGSFESPGFTSTGSFVTLGYNNTFITGWIVFDTNIDYVKYWTDSDGTYAIDLNGNQPGGIAQTFDTVPNQRYEVLFDMAGNPTQSEDFNLKTMVVSASGNSSSSYSFDVTGHTSSNMGWTTFSYIFQAYDTSTTLSFLSTSNAGNLACGPALDNVRVTPISNLVPIPASILLFGSGMVGLGAFRRRFKR